jgi:carbamoyltransferase
MIVLGINAVFHDPAAAIVVDGNIVAASEEERFSRRKHGKPCVPFSTWELPENAARWCLRQVGIVPQQLDAIGYSYDPALAPADGAELWDNEYEALRTFYVRRAPNHLADLLPGFDKTKFRFIAHHVAHAASAACSSWMAAVRRPPFSPAAAGAATSRRSRASRYRTRWACATKS